MSAGRQQPLQRYAQPLFVSSGTTDVNVPFSYKDWIKNYQGIIPGQEFKQYNEYVTRWYRDRKEDVTSFKSQLRLNYLELLKQLQTFFTREEAENWYNNVSLDNEKELLLAIPYFAKKLKDISLYYLQLRTAVKQSKIRYNQIGANTGVVNEIQKFILSNYTKNPNTSISVPGSVWKNLPELSAIKDSIAIEIEELYDYQNYFDHSPTLPPSAYYITDSTELENFLSTKGLALTSTNWIYSLGVNNLSADYTDIAGQSLKDLSEKIAQKYLGEDKFTTFSSSSSAEKRFLNLEINAGNNFFYWPEGVYRTKAINQLRLQPVQINESGLNTVATAGSSLEIADTIFVKTPRGIEGAWFNYNPYDYKTESLNAVFGANTKTTFRYPFPGYGLSADDISWTGFSLKFNPTYFFLEENLQQLVEKEYWTTQIDLSTTTPLLINDTTIVDSKAYSSFNFNRADKIDVWFDTPGFDTPIFNGLSKKAWLYTFKNTDISVSSGENRIVWPYEKINPVNDYPSYYPTAISDVCSPVPVSDINIDFSIAGDDLTNSDTIYKVINYQDTLEDAVECCWLSGNPLLIPQQNAITTQQNNFQLFINSGEFVKFIWTGRDNIDADEVFRSIPHQLDCKFATSIDQSYLNFNQCTCKQVNFTPFGHPGETFTDNRSFTDFIIEDNFTPNNLDLSIWKDDNNNDITTSPSFAWYKTNSKIGWGDGRWYSGSSQNNNRFYLQTGKKYVYYRVKAQVQDATDIILPPYVVRFLDNFNPNTGKWLRAYKNEDNVWVKTTDPSRMILSPGDTIVYNRVNTTSFTLTGTTTEIQYSLENRGSIWSDFDYLTINDNTPEGALQSVVISYPNTTALTPQNNTQYPSARFEQILSIAGWTITHNQTQQRYTLNRTPIANFTPTLTGTYSVSVTAITSQNIPPTTVFIPITSLNLPATSQSSFYYLNTGVYVFNTIPQITAVSPNVEVPALTSYNTPVPGFVWNTPLSGWDYNLSIKNPNAVNRGARPFWATVYNEKTEATQFKGIESWGTPQRVVDEYNILTQPEISDITLTIGNRIEYTRNNPVDLNWIQPITFRVFVDNRTWCTLLFETTGDSNLAYQLNNFKNELVVTPTSSTSNLTFYTFIDNEPTEVYYNALNSFVWPVTATPEVQKTIYDQVSADLAIEANQPWGNLTNTFYPTIAIFPSVDRLYSATDRGGFFSPTNLGISTYLDKDFTSTLEISSTVLTNYYEDGSNRIGGRGFTKQDQPTPYINLKENNIWLKEPTVAGPIAGTIKKSIFKKYQKFYPYQSGYETNSRLQVGMLTPTSRQSPWGNSQELQWTDSANFPQSPTGEINVQAWADSQILKQTGLQVDNWCTDIFGNQYALYKDLQNVSPVDRKLIPGEIWVRKNSQFTSPASIALNNVFDTYLNTNLINELTGKGIYKIDVFFDTLLVETSGGVIFEKLNYNFNTDSIFSLTDEARFISLAMPVSANFNKEFTNIDLTDFNFALAGETWFFPNEKQIFQTTCGIENYILTPELYSYDLNTLNLRKIFPVLTDDINTIKELSSLSIASIEPPILSYNPSKKEFLFVLICKNISNNTNIVELTIKNLTTPFISNVTVYEPVPATAQLNPPFISQDLFTDVSITNIDFVNALNFQCVVDGDGLGTFEIISAPDWVGLSQNGLFIGTPPLETSIYFVTFKVTNSVGPTFYSLQINVNYTFITTVYYLYTEGYEVSQGEGLGITDDNGYIVQEEHDPDNDVIALIVADFE